MKIPQVIKDLVIGLTFISLIAITIGSLIALVKWGPLSQSSQVLKSSSNNLAAVAASNIQPMTEFPITDITYQPPWQKINGFRSPWTPGTFLDILISNGPLEGFRTPENHAVIVGDIILIRTHAWMNAKSWGLAFNPLHKEIPIPYWSKQLAGDWYVWYIGGSGMPSTAGIWYE
mgnify:CR=1 FL=1